MSSIDNDYKAFVAKLFHRNGDLSKDLAHAVLGIYTESYELRHATDRTNAIEEGGDLTFFVVALSLVVHEAIAEAPVDPEEIQNIWRRIRQESTAAPAAFVIESFNVRLADIAKRWVGYGKQPTWQQMVEANMLGAHVLSLALGSSWVAQDSDEFLIRANMAKLLKRYPGGEFDAYRAVNRDVEAERAAIQQA